MNIETKSRILNCFVISNIIYGSDCWTEMKKGHETMNMWFYRCGQRRFNEKKNDIVLLRIRKRHLKYLRYIRRKGGVENVTLTGNIEDKRIKRKRAHNLLNGFVRMDTRTGTIEAASIQKLLWSVKDRNVESLDRPRPYEVWHKRTIRGRVSI